MDDSSRMVDGSRFTSPPDARLGDTRIDHTVAQVARLSASSKYAVGNVFGSRHRPSTAPRSTRVGPAMALPLRSRRCARRRHLVANRSEPLPAPSPRFRAALSPGSNWRPTIAGRPPVRCCTDESEARSPSRPTSLRTNLSRRPPWRRKLVRLALSPLSPSPGSRFIARSATAYRPGPTSIPESPGTLTALPGRFGACGFLHSADLGQRLQRLPLPAPWLRRCVTVGGAFIANGFLFAPLRRDRTIPFSSWAQRSPRFRHVLHSRPIALPWVSIGVWGQRSSSAHSWTARCRKPAYAASQHAQQSPRYRVHLVSLDSLATRSIGIRDVRETIARADAGIPKAPDVGQRIVVLMNPPAEPMASYVTVTRAALGEPRPRAMRWLADGPGPIDVTRVDDRTLRVRPNGGFIRLPSEALLRSTRVHPFSSGDEIALTEMHVTVTATTSEGGPAEILARFDHPLGIRVHLARRNGAGAHLPPPAVGARVTLPSPITSTSPIRRTASRSATSARA
jgi:hypothetical protein